MATELTFKLARDTDGRILIEESVLVARRAIEEYAAKRETEEADIALAVDSVFAEHPGALQNRKAIVGGALIMLRVQPGAYIAMEKRVNDYLTLNTDRQADSDHGIVADLPRTRLYGRKGGPKGGLFRWVDVPAGTNV